MQVRDPEAILTKLGERTLKIDSFFLRRTGFVSNQTVLKLGEYNLNCVPATFGRHEAQFLAALTPTEVDLFSKYKTGIHLLILTFDDPESSDVFRFPLKVSLQDLSPILERKNLCHLVLRYRALPTEYVLFLGLYLDELEASWEAWQKLASEGWTFTIESARAAGLGDEITLLWGGASAPVLLTSLGAARVVIHVHQGLLPESAVPAQLRLHCQKRALTLVGKVDAAGFVPEFHADWLDFMRQVRLRNEFRIRSESSS